MSEELGQQVQTQNEVAIPPVEQPQEQYIPKSKVDEMMRHTAARVAQKARQDAEAQYQAQLQASQQTVAKPSVTEEDIQKKIDEATRRHIEAIRENEIKIFHEQRNQATVQQLSEKIQKSAKEATEKGITDYENVVYSLPYDKMGQLRDLVNEFDNSGDLLYEMGKNNRTLAFELHKQFEFDPVGAKGRLQEISQSIKNNDQARKTKIPNPPSQQIQPSPVKKITDSGDLSVSDHAERLRNKRKV